MRITRIESIPFRLPVRRDFRWNGLEVGLGAFVLVRVHTDDGVVGLGEATPIPDWGGDHGHQHGETQGTVISVIDQNLAPVLIGSDPMCISRAHEVMNRTVKGHPFAKAAIEFALYDIAGKVLDQPVYQLLGGCYRDEVPIAHMVGLMAVDQAREEAGGAVADGAIALQVKGGEDPSRDVDLIKQLRDDLGDEVIIRLDINQGYGAAKATMRNLVDVLPLIDYLEQPAIGLAEMAQLTAALRPSVIVDESCWSPHDAYDVARNRAADVISIYLAKSGGFRPASDVAAISDAVGIACDVNGCIESGIGNAANLHFAVATPAVEVPCVIPVSAPKGEHAFEIAGRYYEDDIITEPFPTGQGTLRPLEKPGLGIEVDEDKLERFREDR